VDPVTLSIATTVVKEIINSMGGDGGLGATLQTINGKLDITITQLASVQKSLAYVMEKVSSIKQDLSDALSQESIYRSRITVQAQVSRLIELADKARREGTPLEDRKQTQTWLDWRAKFLEFDQQWAEIIISKEASTIEASFICKTCLDLFTGGWAYGVIDDKEFATRLEFLRKWLKKMKDENDTLSVRKFLLNAIVSEKKLIANAGMNDRDFNNLSLAEQNNVIRSEIAAKLYIEGWTSFYLECSFDTQYWHNDVPSGWRSIGIYRAVFAVNLSIPLGKDENETILFGTSIEQDTGAALYRPNNTTYFEYGLVGIDLSMCEKEQIAPLQFDWDTREAQELTIRLIDIPAPLDHVLRNSARWQYISNRDKKAYAAATQVLQLVNVERLKIALAEYCLEFLDKTRSEVQNFQKIFPYQP